MHAWRHVFGFFLSQIADGLDEQEEEECKCRETYVELWVNKADDDDELA